MAQSIPFKGWAPDLDPATPGVLSDCKDLIPTIRGMQPAPQAVQQIAPFFPSTVLGAALSNRLDGTKRMFAGTSTKLYEDVSNAWTSVGRAAAYTTPSDGRWRFDIMGQATVAVNGGDKVQVAIDGNFNDVAVGVASITMTNGGSGYTTAPTVTLSAPASGVTATATANLTGSTVTSISLTNVVEGYGAGSGYTTAPTVTITGGGGTGATAVANLVSVPIGKIVAVIAEQVFVCNMSSPAGQMADSWFCSGIADYTAWTASQSTQCAYARLIDTPGGITACQALGNNAIIYKNGSMFLGTRVGPPFIWQWDKVSVKIGTYCQESVISIGTAHYFIGPDNFYMYQVGGQPTPIGDNVKEWFYADINPQYTTKMASFYDEQKSLLYWAYVSNNSIDGTMDRCIVYNWRTGTWGRMDRNISCYVSILNGQFTYDNLGTSWNTWDDLPAISYDSNYWTYSRVTLGYIDGSGALQALIGVPTTSSFTVGMLGDDISYSRLTIMKLRFSKKNTVVDSQITGTWYGAEQLGDPDNTLQSTPIVGMHDNQVDIDYSARWHRVLINMNGSYEITGIIPTLIQEGSY